MVHVRMAQVWPPFTDGSRVPLTAAVLCSLGTKARGGPGRAAWPSMGSQGSQLWAGSSVAPDWLAGLYPTYGHTFQGVVSGPRRGIKGSDFSRAF